MNDRDDELERELRRLFSDERLAIPPARSAPLAVAAAARRIRRRRELAVLGGGSLASVVVLVAGFLLTSPMRQEVDQPLAAAPVTETVTSGTTVTVVPPDVDASSEVQQPARKTTTRDKGPAKETAPLEDALESADQATPTPSGSPSAPDENLDQPLIASAVIGPAGYGELGLRMSFDEVKKKGLLADPDAPPPPAGGCASYALAEGDHAVREVHISSTVGVAVITASGAATPEGIAVGSSEEEVQAAYPDLTDDGWGYRAAAAEGAHYRFLVVDGVVEQLHLVRDDQDCGKF